MHLVLMDAVIRKYYQQLLRKVLAEQWSLNPSTSAYIETPAAETSLTFLLTLSFCEFSFHL